MIIAVYVSSSQKNPASNFIVETFFPLFKLLGDHHFILITDVSNNFEPLSHFEKITAKPKPKNPLLKILWIERTLTALLKKMKADIFISADNFCSLHTSIPQCILMPAQENIKLAYAKKAHLIVTNELAKKELIDKYTLREDMISIVYASPGIKYSTLDAEKREAIMTKFSSGKEYFLCYSNFQKQEDFINFLKSFSNFKKRQQSSFKLLIIGTQNFSVDKNLENYKYRNDVAIVSPGSIGEKAAITAAAYALVLPFNTNEDITNALGAMQSGVPVITTKESSIKEIGGDAVLYSEKEIREMGESMMQLYKDEILRTQLIEKGKELVKNFTEEKSARQLWQSIMKAMN